LDVAPMERCRVYYKEGGGFPQVRAVVSLVNSNCPWLVLTPKVLQLCTNYLVLVLCMFVWVVEACHFFLVPSSNSNMPLYPSKVLWVKECAPTLPLFSVWTHIWVPQGVGSASFSYLPCTLAFKCFFLQVLQNYIKKRTRCNHGYKYK
jgi:hypothetical protein